MITPEFHLEQFDDHLVITIKALYVKSNDVEIYMEENEFKFYVKPYYLRLYFPCNIIEDGREKAQYDISTGVFKIEIPKANPGEHFPNLDMLTTLLAKKKQQQVSTNKIEVVGGSDVITDEKTGVVNENENESDEEGSIDWEVEQELYQPPDVLLTGAGYKYGFANKAHGVLARLQDELFDVIDVPSPDTVSYIDRRVLRQNDEKNKFNSEHYVADLLDDALIQELIKYQAPWDVEYERILAAYKASYPETSGLITPKGNHVFFMEEENFSFTDDEKTRLLALPNRDYILEKDEEQMVLLSLLDIIFAHAYNYRTTEGESTSESPWTICKISATLCWFDSFKNPEDVLASCARRCLCFPLYRHWFLIQKVFNDVKRIFLLGRRWLVRCLLDVRAVLQSDENKYILNDLYITDMCIWLQKVKKKKILSLSNKLQCLKINKVDLDLDLSKVEEIYDWIDESSGSEEDSSSDSSSLDEDVTSSESSLSDDTVTSLDSDDLEDDEVDSENENQAGQDVVALSKKTTGNSSSSIGVIKTGLEELLAAQKFAED